MSILDEFEVEKIIEKKFDPFWKTERFLVKWRGYSNEYNTWETEENLSKARHILDKFKRKQKQLEDEENEKSDEGDENYDPLHAEKRQSKESQKNNLMKPTQHSKLNQNTNKISQNTSNYLNNHSSLLNRSERNNNTQSSINYTNHKMRNEQSVLQTNQSQGKNSNHQFQPQEEEVQSRQSVRQQYPKYIMKRLFRDKTGQWRFEVQNQDQINVNNLDETLAIVGEKTLIMFLASKLVNGTTDDLVPQTNKPI